MRPYNTNKATFQKLFAQRKLNNSAKCEWGVRWGERIRSAPSHCSLALRTVLRGFAGKKFNHTNVIFYKFSYFRNTTSTTALNPGTDHNNEDRLENEFSAIFRQHEYRLFTLALRLTKSSETAKDIVQDVFLKLWDQRATFHSIHNMEAWLYRVTENKVIDFLRKTSADSRLRKKIWYHLQQIVDDSEQQVALKEYHSIIQQAVDQLPPQRKLIYQLHKETGLNYSQIADELQLSKHTVKNQIFSAVQTVRRFLSRHTKFFFFF